MADLNSKIKIRNINIFGIEFSGTMNEKNTSQIPARVKKQTNKKKNYDATGVAECADVGRD